MRFNDRLILILLLTVSSCRKQDVPITYEAVAIDKVGEMNGKGDWLHRYVQVEGHLSMPAKIFTLYGGGTMVTLHESRDGGRKVETSIKVGRTGINRLIQKADMYDENTLKIADKDGVLLAFSDPVVIRGEVRSGVGEQSPACYIVVDEIRKATPR